jgi:hypothetical protein
MANALSRLPNQAKLVGVPNQTIDAHMFILQLKWLQILYDYLTKGMMLERFTTSQQQYLVQRVKLFVIQNEIIYRFGQDNRFCHVL